MDVFAKTSLLIAKNGYCSSHGTVLIQSHKFLSRFVKYCLFLLDNKKIYKNRPRCLCTCARGTIFLGALWTLNLLVVG